VENCIVSTLSHGHSVRVHVLRVKEAEKKRRGDKEMRRRRGGGEERRRGKGREEEMRRRGEGRGVGREREREGGSYHAGPILKEETNKKRITKTKTKI
jgi:hypothetical protein